MKDQIKLLVVEDHRDIAEMVYSYFERRNCIVDYAADGLTGLHLAASNDYDVIVLDLMLPGLDGVELCRKLRREARKSTPLLMLTARDSVEDRVAGLDAGADDYLVKPFAFAELEARVRALLRRDSGGSPVITAGDLVLDPAAFRATRDGRDLPLTVKEFALLEYFMRNRGEVLSQERLLEHVWDEMADPFTNTVRVTVSNLRKKLGDPQVIETVPGRGYVVR